MYEYPTVNTCDNMKEDLNKIIAIRIKLISNDFFNIDNLHLIRDYIDASHLNMISIDMGVDKVIKFDSYIPIQDILSNYEIPKCLRYWINSSSMRSALSSILTQEEIQFLDLHFEMLYQIETFQNSIYIRM